MEEEDTVVLDVSQEEMEEGELSDDGVSLPDSAAKSAVVRTPIKMDLPDLLKELKGAEDFQKVDAETVSKMSARAERFQTGNSVSFEEISRLYSSMKVIIPLLTRWFQCVRSGQSSRERVRVSPPAGDDLRLVPVRPGPGGGPEVFLPLQPANCGQSDPDLGSDSLGQPGQFCPGNAGAEQGGRGARH